MSTNRSEGRVGALRSNVLERLKANDQLTGLLARTENVDDGADAIVPAYLAERAFDPDGPDDPPDVRVAVSTVTGSSARENHQERKSLTVQAVLNVRFDVLGSLVDGQHLGLAWHDDVLDEIAGELTTQVEGWTAQGQTGGTPEPLPDEDANRYRSPQRFDFMRRD